jgi:hypothetical protein
MTAFDSGGAENPASPELSAQIKVGNTTETQLSQPPILHTPPAQTTR